MHLYEIFLENWLCHNLLSSLKFMWGKRSHALWKCMCGKTLSNWNSALGWKCGAFQFIPVRKSWFWLCIMYICLYQKLEPKFLQNWCLFPHFRLLKAKPCRGQMRLTSKCSLKPKCNSTFSTFRSWIAFYSKWVLVACSELFFNFRVRCWVHPVDGSL